jgi:hypothetical protein
VKNLPMKPIASDRVPYTHEYYLALLQQQYSKKDTSIEINEDDAQAALAVHTIKMYLSNRNEK